MSFKVSVQPGGQEFSAEPGQTVLDAALAAGYVLPYSCRTGACSTCRGRIVSGSYEAGDAPAHILEASDLAQGYTLLCQARPQSDLVIEPRELRMAGDIVIARMPVRVTALTPLAHDVMEVTLQLPSSQAYRYHPGQYLDFLLKDGRRRSYSMASPPGDDHAVRLHVRHMPGGAFTAQVFGETQPALKARDILRIEGPLGSFFLREESAKPVVFLASGTGFAPIKAIIEHMIAQGIERPAVLYWGGRRPRDLYLDALAASWQDALPGFRYVPVVSEALPEDAWAGRTGYVHEAVMADLPDLSGHQVYACGTPPMVEAARRDFTQRCGLPAEEFFSDPFTSEIDRIEAHA